ncbi:MAG: hypothetical protein ACREJ2_09410 [Planctomycetota bacterium]
MAVRLKNRTSDAAARVALAALCCLGLGLGLRSLAAYDFAVDLPNGEYRLRWPVSVPTDPAHPEALAPIPGRSLFLEFTAWTETATQKPILITLELINGRGEWYQTARNLAIGFNQPREIAVDMSADSADWIPAGHFKPWSAGALAGVRALTYRVSSSETVKLTVHLSPPVWHGGDAVQFQPAAVTLCGFDATRDCFRCELSDGLAALAVAADARETDETAMRQFSAAWPVQAYASGAIAGEWHPVGPALWCWRPASGSRPLPGVAKLAFQGRDRAGGFVASGPFIPTDTAPPAEALQPLPPAQTALPRMLTPPSRPTSPTPSAPSASSTPSTPSTSPELQRAEQPELASGPTTATAGDAPSEAEPAGGSLDFALGRLRADFTRMQVNGRLLLAETGPAPALTGQPAHWSRWVDGRWQPCDAERSPAAATQGAENGSEAAPPPGRAWAWKTPNFILDPDAFAPAQPSLAGPAAEVPVQPAPPTPSGETTGGGSGATESPTDSPALLNPKIAWAWEEALSAAHQLGAELPAVVWSDRDLNESTAYRWGLNPWHRSVEAPGLIFADARAQAREREVFARLVRRFDHPGGVREWRIALTAPLEGEMTLSTCYGLPAADLPPGTQVLCSHPACLGEAPPLWSWQSGQPDWDFPTGWASVDEPKYHMAAPVKTNGFLLVEAASAANERDVPSLPAAAAARLVLRADPDQHIEPGRWADDLADGAYLDIDLQAVGRGAAGRVAIDIVTGDWLRYHALSPVLLQSEARTRVRFSLGDDSLLRPVQSDLYPDVIADLPPAHTPAWRGYRMRRIREIVVSFFRTDGPIQARIYRMQIRPTRPGDTVAPAVHPWAPDAGQAPPAPAGSLLEFDADVRPMPRNPYDLTEVDLRLCATGPDGQTVEVPAFWFEPEQRRPWPVVIEGKAVDAEAMVPVGVARFRARLRLRQPGAYKLEWRLYSHGHFTTTSTKLSDFRYDQQGDALPIPGHDYMVHWWHADERAEQEGRPLYGSVDANRKVARVTYDAGPLTATADQGTVEIAADPPGRPPLRYIRVSKTDPSQFEFDDGSDFYPVGINLRSPSDARVPFKSSPTSHVYDDALFQTLDARATYQMDDYISAFSKHGINWARVWMSSWWLALEWRRDYPGYGGVGDYNQAHAARLDHLLDQAEKDGMYLQITLDNHGMYSPEIDTQWADNPYNAKLGGPCKSMLDFFSQAQAQEWHLMRLRYIVARYGASPAIHAWELCSEMEFVGEYGPHYVDYERGLSGRKAVVLDGWVQATAAWLKRWDVEGRHIVTTHFSHPYQGQSTLALKCIEVPMANAYSAYPELYPGAKDPKNDCQAAVAADAYWNGFRDPHSHGIFAGFKQYGKPVLVGEHGRHWMGVDMRYNIGTPNTPVNLLADMHCMLWAQYMRPYAGDTGFWWWLPLYFEKGWLDHYAAFTQFSAGEDRRGLKAQAADAQVDRDGLGCMSCFDPTAGRGYAWVFERGIQQDLDSATHQTGVHLTLPVQRPGEYTVEYWHTLAPTPSKVAPEPVGATLKFATLTCDVKPGQTALTVALPEFSGDMALKIHLKTTEPRK